MHNGLFEFQKKDYLKKTGIDKGFNMNVLMITDIKFSDNFVNLNLIPDLVRNF